MKTLIIRITLVIFGIGLGFFLVVGSSTSISKSAELHRLSRSQRKNSARLSAAAEPEQKDLQRLIRTLRENRQTSEFRRELERLSVGELRSGMLEVMATLPKNSMFSSYSNHFLLGLFGAELYRREGEAALEWAEKQDADGTGFYQAAMSSILKAAAASSPSVLKRWIGKLPDNLQQWEVAQYYTIAINSAASRGADDWSEAAQIFVGYWNGSPYYPDDFDFSRMLKNAPNGSGVNEALSYWAAKGHIR